MKPRVYIETSVISYLVSRPSRDLIVAAHQQITQSWWLDRRDLFECVVSEAGVAECTQGDRRLAQQRLEAIRALPILTISEQSQRLAIQILQGTGLPQKALVDALHIAIAAEQGVDFLLSWNCKHIANAEIARRVRHICADAGFISAQLCTPTELMGVN